MSHAVGQDTSAARSRCQNGDSYHVVFSRPWRGEGYAEDKEGFFRFVRQNRYHGRPTRLSEAVGFVYGEDYTNTQYRRLERFAKRTDWFEIRSTGGFVAVEPTPACFKTDPLETQKALGKNARRGGGENVKTKTGVESGEAGEGQTQSYPKDRARATLEKRGPRLDGPGEATDYRAGVLAELAAYRTAIADRYHYLERDYQSPVAAPRYLILPYLTRYNDGGRARRSQRRFRTRLETAAERYSMASTVSLTVNPKRFESHAEATEEAGEAVGRFLSWLPYQLGRDSQPEKVKITDFQRNGLIHFHIVLFGVKPVDDGESEAGEETLSEAEVRDYWDGQAGVGNQVSVDPAFCPEGRWLLHDDDMGQVSLSYYLGKRIRELVRFAEADDGEARDLAEADDGSLWRHALFWVYQKRYESGSRSLLEDGEDDDGEGDGGEDRDGLTRWRYVGTASFGQIPQNVVDDAIICRRGRPPPGETGSASSAGTASTADAPGD